MELTMKPRLTGRGAHATCEAYTPRIKKSSLIVQRAFVVFWNSILLFKKKRLPLLVPLAVRD